MVSKGIGGLPPRHQTPMQQRRRFVPGQSARHSSSSLSSSDGSYDEHMSNQANNGSKYLHLVIPSNLYPGQEGNDFEERQCTEEERSMARSGCTLDRFGDLGIDENDEADDEAEVASNEGDDINASVEKDDKVNANDDTCVQFEPDVMYDDEGNQIEFMFDDEGNRVEKMDQEDDDIIWQKEDDEEETEERETARPNRDGLPPLPPPKCNSGKADIRERFNQTGQSWLRTKQLLNQQQEQQSLFHDQAELNKENSRKLYLSDSDSTEEVVEAKQQVLLPPISQKKTSEQRHVRFANVVDTRIFLAEEENDEQEISENVAVEPPKSQAQREEASSRIESMRMALEDDACDEDDAPRVDVEEDEESEVFNTCNFDELEERDEVEAEDEGVLFGEMTDFSYSRASTFAENVDVTSKAFVVNTHVQQSAYGPKLPPQHQVASGGIENKENDENDGDVKATARLCKSSDLTNLYDGSIGDVGSILNDLRGVEAGRKNVNSVPADDDNGNDEEEVSTNILAGEDESDDNFNRETSASPNEQDCMELNDDVLRSYQLMKEREEKQLEIELHKRQEPAVVALSKSSKVPVEVENPRYPYRHGHSLGDEVSDIFTEMSSLGPWAVSKKMDGYRSHNPPNGTESHEPESNRSEDVISPHQGWVRPDLSLDDSMGDSLVGKMLTLVPSHKANPSMLSTPFEDGEGADNEKAKRRRWPFGKKKKQKDAHVSGATNHFAEKEGEAHQRNLDHRHGESFEQQYGEVYDPEYYQRKVEENAMQLHMAADYAALQLIENDQQRRAKKQDMFRQEMEDRAREEEEALRQQEAAVLQAINSGNQDDLAAILSSNSQWAPEMTTANASNYHTHPSQQKSLLQSFVQGELCTSENAKYIEGKAKRIADVLREAFDDDSDVSDAQKYHPKYAYA